MSFHISQHERGGAVVLELSGRFVLGEPVEQFRAVLEELLGQGKNRIALDMRKVDYIDSSALGCLVMAHTKVTRAGGAMSMFGLNEKGLELLVITKLATIFRIGATETDAINLLFPDRTAKSFDILEFVRKHWGETAGGGS
ncbi:MAG: STAS domain-containing protein [Bryobacteraceae bacterium]|nr:STAS domain-containing protein [Bryobacteraceae bacterium]MCX7604422.1 STAS domain-containing protein [Bryobacteraceae bacterium]